MIHNEQCHLDLQVTKGARACKCVMDSAASTGKGGREGAGTGRARLAGCSTDPTGNRTADMPGSISSADSASGSAERRETRGTTQDAHCCTGHRPLRHLACEHKKSFASTHLVINGVELGEHDAVDAAPAGGTRRRSGRRCAADTGQRSGRQLLQGAVELGQLVHCIIANLWGAEV